MRNALSTMNQIQDIGAQVLSGISEQNATLMVLFYLSLSLLSICIHHQHP